MYSGTLFVMLIFLELIIYLFKYNQRINAEPALHKSQDD